MVVFIRHRDFDGKPNGGIRLSITANTLQIGLRSRNEPFPSDIIPVNRAAFHLTAEFRAKEFLFGFRLPLDLAHVKSGSRSKSNFRQSFFLALPNQALFPGPTDKHGNGFPFRVRFDAPAFRSNKNKTAPFRFSRTKRAQRFFRLRFSPFRSFLPLCAGDSRA